MKIFVAFAFLATLGLLAEARLKGLKPRNIVMPVNPNYHPEFAGKVNVPAGDNHRITNGFVADRGQFPYQVALSVDSAWFCGGILISEEWVVTAAHCAGNIYEVILGANRMDIVESGSLTILSAISIVHENYDSSTINNDITLIKISAITPTDFIAPVKLPCHSPNPSTYAGETATASGWGKISDASGGISYDLNFVDLEIISNTVCAGVFGSIITDTKLCVATPDGQSPCNGDSGGPLVVRDSADDIRVVGIVSFGSSAGCQASFPAAFTRVTSYLEWIELNTGLPLEHCE